MAKLTLTDLANLQNEGTAVSAINANSALIETAMEKTLSRDGTSPNSMTADLDMNSNRILNLLDAASDREPITLSQFQEFQEATLGDIQETLDFVFGSTPNLFLVRGETEWGSRAIVGDDLPNPSTLAKGGVFSQAASGGSVLSGINTSGQPTIATSLTLLGSSSGIIAVGRQGAVQPAFQVNASAASSITGISISSQAAGNGVHITAIGETNVPVTINAAGSGTINFATASTGIINFYRDTFYQSGFGVASPLRVTDNSASALAVGRLGATTPALQVDASTASSVTGLKVTAAAAAGGVDFSAISSGTNESLTINAKGTGTITLGNTSTGNIASSRPVVITNTATGIFAAGRAGATNPSFRVDAGASNVNGLSVGGADTGNGVVMNAIGSDANVGLAFSAKGSGSVTFYTQSTANIGMQVLDTAGGNRFLTIAGSNGGNPTISTSAGDVAVTPHLRGTASITAHNGTAIPAGGTAGAGFRVSSATNFGVFFGSGVPTLSASQGSLYLRSDGSSTSTRLYVNTDGGTTWTNVTTAA